MTESMFEIDSYLIKECKVKISKEFVDKINGDYKRFNLIILDILIFY